MGNSQNANKSPTPSPPLDGDLDLELKEKIKKYTPHELNVLDSIFRELASRSPGPTMDKATFLQYFSLPGMLGERLFTVFDRKQNGVIEYEEFVAGLADFSRGTMDEKIKVLFRMYDLTGDGAVSREELTTMLHSLVTPTADILNYHSYHPHTQEEDEETRSTVHQIVQQVFDSCDLDSKGRLDFRAFKRFIAQTPDVIALMESVLVRHSWIHLDNRDQELSTEAPSPMMCMSCDWKCKYCYDCGTEIKEGVTTCPRCQLALGGKQNSFKFCMQCGQGLVTVAPNLVSPRLEHRASLGAVSVERSFSFNVDNKDSNDVIMEGILYKRGKLLQQFTERFFVLRANFLYAFKSRDDVQPYRVLFLEGCLIEEPREDPYASNNYFGLDIKSFKKETLPNGQTRVTDNVTSLYVRSLEKRREWIQALRKGANAVPFEDHYILGDKIGKGRFSVVHLCPAINSGERFAVKVVDKESLDERETEALRTEIAILKLVSHPNIMRLKEVFETPDRLFIVMKLIHGGDLFERIKKRKVFPETVAREVVWSLLSAVRYLHARGIVHRDLKPENILCLDENDDTQVMISDFGLSKFASRAELMKIACGTLCYVAPEVLRMQGYSFSVDIWSIGVILYLLLRGRLPFDGKNKDEIIDRTLMASLDFSHAHWNTVSAEAKDLITHLLCKDPHLRFTEDQARAHSWFDPVRKRIASQRDMSSPEAKARSSRSFGSPFMSVAGAPQSPFRAEDLHIEPLSLDEVKHATDNVTIPDSLRSPLIRQPWASPSSQPPPQPNFDLLTAALANSHSEVPHSPILPYSPHTAHLHSHSQPSSPQSHAQAQPHHSSPQIQAHSPAQSPQSHPESPQTQAHSQAQSHLSASQSPNQPHPASPQTQPQPQPPSPQPLPQTRPSSPPAQALNPDSVFPEPLSNAPVASESSAAT